jgi:hypothetical protein
MRKSRGSWIFFVFFPFAFLIATINLSNSIVLAAESGGTIQGRFVWADNTPVTKCKVKIFDKLETFKGINTGSSNQSVQNIRISKKAKVKEISVDSEGRFKFTNLPPGTYYIFFKASGTYQGDNWAYRHYQSANLLPLAGHQEEPEHYELGEKGNIQVKDFGLIRLLKPGKPKLVPGKPGIVKFQWIAENEKPGMVTKIVIGHKEYDRDLPYPFTRKHEMPGNSFQIAENEPLIPGRYEFTVIILTPASQEYAKSKSMDFVVPGEVYRFHIRKVKEDSSGTTLSWSGSAAIKFLRVVDQDGSVKEIAKEKTIILPANKNSKNTFRMWYFDPLNSEQKELLPGWRRVFLQTRMK